MRKQYHLKKSSKGLLAYDIERLLKLAIFRKIEVKDISLSEIQEIDECYWYRTSTEVTTRSVLEHTRLINEADLSYPILLSKEGLLLDGMHRICKAILNGKETIEALQLDIDIEPDFVGVDESDLPYN